MAEYIYRSIDLRIWGDARVRALSRPPPNGRDLWLYLLTAKESIAIPGVIPAGAAALAETLRWPVEGFREAFGEVSRQGMAVADWEAPLVWVPNAIRYNPPQSPNVVRAWGKAFRGVPDSPLKPQVFRALKDFLEGFGEGYRKAFADAFGQPCPNQDQEQDQDQDAVPRAVEALQLLPPPGPPDHAGAKAPSTTPPKERKQSVQQRALTWALEERAKVTNTTDRPIKPGEVNARLKPVVEELGVPGFKSAFQAFLADGYARDRDFPIRLFMAEFRRYRQLPAAAVQTPAPQPVSGDVDPYREGP